MPGRQYESDQVTGRHDRHDDAAWFHYQPNAAGPAPHGVDADTFVRESMTVTHARPRSIPPEEAGAVVHHGRSWSPSRSRSRSNSRDGHRSRGLVRGGLDSHFHHRSQSRSNSRSRSRVGRARDIVEDNLTASTAGIGASIIGAVVGGFVANRASEALQNRSHRSGGGGGTGGSRYDPDHANVPRIASTIIGAVAGGLGANVLASHLGDHCDRSRDRSTWERQYSREEYEYRRMSRGGEYDRDEEAYDFVNDAEGKHEPRPRSRGSDYRN
ncbi:hypothetical protein ESCO_001062 [Escovopsis weberi]|uniref:Glycine zipper 2TM domain-containing protein n=1 Tax=Escovopsis weberi TaxID=150374 RepID=A0A0M8MYN7_ESCWE|nr:hypothetical protein ESCO_001062 [Escovopsis weberi]